MIKNSKNLLTSKEAADYLGFSQIYIRCLILSKKLKAIKIGKMWLIDEKDLKKIKRQRYPRPKEFKKDGSNK